MDKSSSSRSKTAELSLCDVCQGLGDTKSPRGFLVERAVNSRRAVDYGDTESERFVHTYVHHAEIGVLLAFAQAGCGACNVFLNQLKQSDSFFERVREAGSRSVRPDAEILTTLPQDDVLKATQLAELGKRQNLYRKNDLAIHGHGRIVIQTYFNEEPYLWWKNGPYKSTVFALGTDLFGGFSHFHTPYDAIDPNGEHRPSKDLLSEPHIRLVNRWRHTCEMGHKSCNETTSQQPLPSRVLKLLDPSNEKRGVRLLETHRKMMGKYACLSYCWGHSDIQLGRTTTANLLQQQESISFNTLPDTVIDTIHLCYKLGLRYLWVDRLCIVQDDQKDWSEEASRMGEIYSRSALTISVPLCTESSQSFLAIRRMGFREQSQFTTIKYTESESKFESRSWFVKESLSRSNGPWFLENSWKNFIATPNYQCNRWLGRGWTFQEWMLSPRVLHVDSITLWDCFDGYANELNRRGMGKARLIRNPREFGKDSSWDAIVQEHSRREVTCEGDILPALAGLASRYAQATGRTYLAGLWREELPRSLLWEDGTPMNRRASDQHMPSWSWASLKRGVHWGVWAWDTFTARASISAVFCQYDPPGSLTTVQKAWIDVDGRLSVPVTEREGRSRRLVSVRIKVGDEWWYADADHGDKFMDDAIAQANVCLLLLGSTAVYYWYHALILQECGWEDDRRCFRRLGTARLPCLGMESIAPDGSLPIESETGWEAQVVRLV